ncbi:GFA family protein [Oricola sp.]|uniref:GFA family protein n=1 Tax=Oricola sp. TaxID=1979950 RepID=UPI003BA8611C
MTDKHTGACLCGAVSFEIEGDFDKFFLCHCSRCRKFSGSAHASNLFSTEGKITWHSGEDRIRHYEVPDTRFAKSFCAECGSPLPRERPSGLMVPAGCLDTPVEIEPDAHIFIADKASWDDRLDEVKTFNQGPG